MRFLITWMAVGLCFSSSLTLLANEPSSDVNKSAAQTAADTRSARSSITSTRPWSAPAKHCSSTRERPPCADPGRGGALTNVRGSMARCQAWCGCGGTGAGVMSQPCVMVMWCRSSGEREREISERRVGDVERIRTIHARMRVNGKWMRMCLCVHRMLMDEVRGD